MQHKAGPLHTLHHENEILPAGLVADPAGTDTDVRGLTMHLSRPHSQPQGASALVGGVWRTEPNTHTHMHANPPAHPNITTHTLIHTVLSLTTNLLTTIGQLPFFCSFH